MPSQESADLLKKARQVETALEIGLEQIRTPGAADKVVDKLETLGTGLEAEAVGESADVRPLEGKIREITDSSRERDGSKAGAVIAATAAQIAGADAKEAQVFDTAIAETTGSSASHVPEDDSAALQRGRRLLRRALVKRLRPLDAIDAIVFLQINRLPHPPVADRVMTRFTNLMHRGDGYLLLLLALTLCDRRRGWTAIKGVVPMLWLATATVEFPIKAFFRRKRPFLSIVRAIIVGKKPASYSFPSGHSAAAFAGAELLKRHYPEGRVGFRLIATLVAFSRVYLGAHYPGDVLVGGACGVFFAKLYRRIFGRS